MIDLHLHTTASDGRSTPEQLVRRVAEAGIKTCAVTDHDTTAGLARARAAAAPLGLQVITGIEITAIHNDLDVHMLGYFFDPSHPELVEFLTAQRADRTRRINEMLDRLAAMDVVLDRRALVEQAARMTGKAMGRPAIARLLVANGHARDVADAFDRYLAAGRPAFVPRRGVLPAEVVGLIGRAGGLVSFAHPGKMGQDDLMPSLAAAGLAAIEVFHPDHDATAMEKYAAMARALNLGVSGGSDFHGPGSGRIEGLGRFTLPQAALEDLVRRASSIAPDAQPGSSA